MRCVLISLFIYLLTLGGHLLFLRTNPLRQYHVNALWLLGLVGAVFYWNMTAVPVPVQPMLWSLPLRSSALIFYLLLLFPYYLFFTNADYDSPSQMIMRLLKRNGPCSREQLLQAMTPQALIVARLDDLCAEGFMRVEMGKYSLRPKGIWLVEFMKMYKTLIGREIHG